MAVNRPWRLRHHLSPSTPSSCQFVAIKEYLRLVAVRGGDGKWCRGRAAFAEDFAWGRERFLERRARCPFPGHPHIVPVLRYFEATARPTPSRSSRTARGVGELLRQPAGRLSPDDVRRWRRAWSAASAPCAPKASPLRHQAVQHHHPA